jgi:hypothetical protein
MLNETGRRDQSAFALIGRQIAEGILKDQWQKLPEKEGRSGEGIESDRFAMRGKGGGRRVLGKRIREDGITLRKMRTPAKEISEDRNVRLDIWAGRHKNGI